MEDLDKPNLFSNDWLTALFQLLLHSTHFRHQLDVGCFQPFKYYYAETIDNAMRPGEDNFSKLEFLAKIQVMRT